MAAAVWLQKDHQPRPWGPPTREQQVQYERFDHHIAPGGCRKDGLENVFTWETTRRVSTRSCMLFFVLWGSPFDDRSREEVYHLL